MTAVIVRLWPLSLLLVAFLVLVASCCWAETSPSPAVDVLGGGAAGGPRRRRAASIMVPITILKYAVDEGAVCMDGSPPAYHLDPGSGAGKNNWIVNLEGGGWCNNARTCRGTKQTGRGSSDHMDKQIPFTGIMSSSPIANPDFYNWNRVKIRYCDGGSFAGDTYDKNTGINFRGQRIWNATIRHLLSIGMASANQVLLTGCSSGGLAVILHCDEFSAFFPPGQGTTVKCLADAGLYLDAQFPREMASRGLVTDCQWNFEENFMNQLQNFPAPL